MYSCCDVSWSDRSGGQKRRTDELEKENASLKEIIGKPQARLDDVERREAQRGGAIAVAALSVREKQREAAREAEKAREEANKRSRSRSRGGGNEKNHQRGGSSSSTAGGKASGNTQRRNSLPAGRK